MLKSMNKSVRKKAIETAWRIANTDKLKKYREDRRADKRARGECIYCGALAKETSTLCEQCTRNSVERRKTLAAKRVAEGFCSQCLTKRADPDRKLCRVCCDQKRRTRADYLRNTYNMTTDKHDAILAAQNGLCAICGAAKSYRLHIDHCHNSREIRGLLCINCNNGLGRFQDNPTILRAAATYLENFNAQSDH